MNRLRKLGAAALLGVAGFGMLTIVSSSAVAGSGKGDPSPIDPECTCAKKIKVGKYICTLATCDQVAPKQFVCTYNCPF